MFTSTIHDVESFIPKLITASGQAAISMTIILVFMYLAIKYMKHEGEE